MIGVNASKQALRDCYTLCVHARKCVYARETVELNVVLCCSRHDQREGMGVLDIPAAKVALANTIEGFSATVRPPLLPASREQQQQLQDAMHRLNNSKS